MWFEKCSQRKTCERDEDWSITCVGESLYSWKVFFGFGLDCLFFVFVCLFSIFHSPLASFPNTPHQWYICGTLFHQNVLRKNTYQTNNLIHVGSCLPNSEDVLGKPAVARRPSCWGLPVHVPAHQSMIYNPPGWWWSRQDHGLARPSTHVWLNGHPHHHRVISFD